MKNTFYAVIIIVLLALAAFLFISPSKTDAPEVEVDEEVEVVEEEVPVSEYQYEIDLERSEITWTAGKKFIVDWVDKGTISVLEGGVNSLDDINNLGGEVVIDMTSIEITQTGSGGGFGDLMGHLESDDFFDVENYTTAKFVATDISAGAHEFTIGGDLTIKDKTKPVRAVLSQWNEEEKFVEGSVTINRLDYGMDFRSEGLIGRVENKVINDTFDINFKIYYK